MNYKVDQIEGIGPAYAAKLNEAGIYTTTDLLDRCSTAYGRTNVANATGISKSLILKWTNHADLMRIKGVAGQFAELLEAAGVDTVKELRNRIPQNLYNKLVETNNAKNLCNRVPSEHEVARMIEEAKELEACIVY